VGRGDETDGEGCREMVADSVFIELICVVYKFGARLVYSILVVVFTSL
jgi:hypothetical protein